MKSIVDPRPNWRIGFGDSIPWYRSLRGFLGALLNALGCLFFGGCAWETLGSAGFYHGPVRQPAYSYHPIVWRRL